jgi:xylulokinase
MRLVAGVDSSTQSTKIELRELESGALHGQASAPHPAVSSPRSEQDPSAWLAAFRQAWAELGSPQVEAISVGGQQHGMVTLDVERQVIRPAKLWNDTESAADADWLVGQFPDGATEWARRVGSVTVAAFTITKLSWLHRQEPQSWSRLAHVLLPHDWMTMQLSGNFTTDRGDASGTGYWSPSTGTYAWEALRLVDAAINWESVVPRVLAPLESAGRWNGAVVAAGTGDNMAAALGLGLRPGDFVVSLGTSGTVYGVSEAPSCDPSGAIAGFADATGRFLPLACTLNATKVTETVRRLLGVDYAELDRLALGAAPGSGGLTLLPYLDGERTPNRPGASGVLDGLRSDVTREQFARAGFEAVACSMLDAYEALVRAAGEHAGRMFLVGGGSRSQAYRRIVADLFGRQLIVPHDDQVVAAGAAVQAAAALTQTDPMVIAERWGLGKGEVVDPDEATTFTKQRYAGLRDATLGW